jgi:hypothetical protein
MSPSYGQCPHNLRKGQNCSPKAPDSDKNKDARCRGGEDALRRNQQWTISQKLWAGLLAIAIGWGLSGCSDRIEAQTPANRTTPPPIGPQLSEVAPPATLQQLRQNLDAYQPQVRILSPREGETLNETSVELQIQVQDLPLFKDEILGLGPHLEVILDREIDREIYDLSEPIIFEGLEPGTHTLQVFASRPWHESFKNEGAYAQVNFHLFSPTGDNRPDRDQPLLTYNSPQGTYGAEPILLDFYLTNAPLHLVAQEDPNIKDWRIRVTANNRSFMVDTWQSLYLKGFQPGQNWLKLELIDENGEVINNNGFNSTVKLITYDPKQQDTLAKLSRDELPFADALGIVDPNYVKPVVPEPEVEEVEPEIAPREEVLSEPEAIEESETQPEAVTEPVVEPTVEAEISEPEAIEPTAEITEPVVEPTVEAEISEPEAIEPPEKVTEPVVEPTVEAEISEPEAIEPPEKVTEPVVEPTVEPEVIEPTAEVPAPEAVQPPEAQVIETPLEPEQSVEIVPEVEKLEPELSDSEAVNLPNSVETLPDVERPTPASTPLVEKAKPKRNFLNRFRKQPTE